MQDSEPSGPDLRRECDLGRSFILGNTRNSAGAAFLPLLVHTAIMGRLKDPWRQRVF